MSCTGLLGGTFNPPHNGHVLLAETAKRNFDIDPLRVHVSSNPPHKRVDVDVETRLVLARLAFPNDTVVCDDNPYSIDTVTGFGLDAIFLVGADQFAKFLTWREPDEILEHVRLGVATRPGYPREKLDHVLSELRSPERVEFFDMEPIPISSSDIRRLAAAGTPIDDLVPPPVAAEIEQRGLYAPRAG
ncbi:MAG TPA: nicotinate-nicotinamide nucleotide adenylyltransferase [Gaiellaceae bacterium]